MSRFTQTSFLPSHHPLCLPLPAAGAQTTGVSNGPCIPGYCLRPLRLKAHGTERHLLASSSSKLIIIIAIIIGGYECVYILYINYIVEQRYFVAS